MVDRQHSVFSDTKIIGCFENRVTLDIDSDTQEVDSDRRKTTFALLCEILAKNATVVSQLGFAGRGRKTRVCKMKVELENRLSPRSLAVPTLQLVCSKELGSEIRKNSSQNKIGSAELSPRELKEICL